MGCGPRWTSLVLAAWLCCATGPLGAAPSSQPAKPVTSQALPKYETVVTGRPVRRDTPPDDPAAFATHIEIVATPGAGLAGLLEEVPGLRVRDYGAGQTQSISLRGAEGHRVAIYLDDVRLSSAAGGVDLALFDPAQLGAVEVRRSAGSARYGDAALGGALIMHTPRLRRRSHTRLSLGYGSWRSLYGNASHGGSWKALRYLASASYRQSEGDFIYRDDLQGEQRRENNDLRAAEALLKGDYLRGNWRISLLDSFVVRERGMPGPASALPRPDRQQDMRNVLALQARRYDLLVSGDELLLALHHRYQRFRFDAAWAAEDSRNHVQGVEARSAVVIPLAGFGRLDAGVELRGELFDDDLPAGDATVGDHRRWVLDAHVSARFGFWQRRLELVPALRVAGATGFEAQLLPKLGVVIVPWRGKPTALGERRRLELLANVGRSFRYPSFSELYARFEGIRGNSALQPEDALSFDAGLRFAWGAVAVEAAYFQRVMANTILFLPRDALSWGAENSGRADARGLESALSWRAWRCLRLRGAYTHTATRWHGAQLVGQPRHLFHGRLAWEGPRCGRAAAGLPRWTRALTLWSAAQVQGAQVLGRADTSPEESRVLLAAGGSYTYRQFTLSAEGRNLLDKRDARDVLGYPLPPARFLLALSAGF